MTSTASKSRRASLLNVAFGAFLLIFVPAALAFSIWQLTRTPDDWALGIVVGGAALASTPLLFSWKVWVPVVLAYAIGSPYLPPTLEDNADYGWYVVIAGWLAFFMAATIAGGIAASRGDDLDPADLGDYDVPAPEPEAAAAEPEVPTRRIVGLCGYAGAGKDTAAKGLLWEGDWHHASFASKLKEFALACNPLIPVHRGMVGYEDFNVTDAGLVYVRLAEYVEKVGLERAKENPEVRSFFQRVGTDAGRELDPNLWVDAAMDSLPGDRNVVFTDVRFPNEAEAIQDAGGYLIRVYRDGHGPVNGHPSETALDAYPVDAAIPNNGTMTELGVTLRRVLVALDAQRNHEF